MQGYIRGKGIYIGLFSSEDLDSGKDRIAIKAKMEETGLKYTNSELVRENGKIVGIKVYVCNADDFKV